MSLTTRRRPLRHYTLGYYVYVFHYLIRLQLTRYESLSDSQARKVHNFLEGARVYLAGPMDFVASREMERKRGWRNRIRQFLEQLACIIHE